jgi:hypothetical protein
MLRVRVPRIAPAAGATDPAITGVRAEGWSCDFTSPPTMDPANAPRFIDLSRQGYDTAGNVAAYTESLILTQRVRQAYPSNASLDASRVSLSDYVYSTDTILGGSSPANNSAETSPKPVCRWALPDRRNVTNSLRLEVVAAHRNARNGEQIAAVKFIVTDGANTVTQTVSASSVLGGTNDRQPVVGYAADINISALTEGQITANAEVYPWIGAAASVNKSADNTAGTRTFCPQVFRKGAGRAVLYAYVDTTGNDTTGVASSTPAAASATPCLTIAGAFAKLRAADGGSITDGHVVRLKAGTQAIGTPASVTHSSISECIIENDPLAGSAPVLNLTGNWNSRHACLRIRGVTIARTTTAQIGGNFVTFENCTYQNSGTGNITPVLSAGAFRWLGCTFTGVLTNLLFPTTNAENRLIRGCTTDAAGTVDPFCSLGNTFVNATLNVTVAAYESGFVGFNRFNLQAGAAVTSGTAGDVSGYAVIQNLVEYTSASTTAPAFRFSGDGNLGNVTHLVCHQNTLTGFFLAGRGNLLYADTAATNRTHKLCSFVGNIHSQINTKHDVFALAAANVNAWAYLYGVGCRGEFSQFIDASSGGIGSAFAQAYPGLNASIGTSSTARNDPLFTNYQGTVSASVAGSGGGTYTLGASSPARNRVANPVLRFDLAGNARQAANDNSGAFNESAGGGGVSVTPLGLVTGAPVIGNPALAQNHALAPAGLTAGAPIIGNPVLAQNHTVAPAGITAGAPVIGVLALTQNHVVAPSGLTAGAPTLGNPALGQNHILSPSALVTGAPVIGAAALTQNHVLAPLPLTAGNPVIGNPAVILAGQITPLPIITGAPVIGSPALGQNHILAPSALVTGGPVLGNPALAQNHALTPAPLVTGAPVLSSPALSQNHALAPALIVTGAPALGSPALAQNHVLAPLPIVTGAPVLGRPTLSLTGGEPISVAPRIVNVTVLPDPVIAVTVLPDPVAQVTVAA